MHGSGLISQDNDDPTAACFWRLAQQAGLERASYANWNVVPWYVSATRKNQNASVKDCIEAHPWLRAFLRALPRLQVVVTMGRVAESAWRRVTPDVPLAHLHAPHPSPKSRLSNRSFEDEILGVMASARAMVHRR